MRDLTTIIKLGQASFPGVHQSNLDHYLREGTPLEVREVAKGIETIQEESNIQTPVYIPITKDVEVLQKAFQELMNQDYSVFVKEPEGSRGGTLFENDDAIGKLPEILAAGYNKVILRSKQNNPPEGLSIDDYFSQIQITRQIRINQVYYDPQEGWTFMHSFPATHAAKTQQIKTYFTLAEINFVRALQPKS